MQGKLRVIINCLVCAVILIMLNGCKQPGGKSVLSISPQQQTIAVGSVARIDIEIKNAANLYGLQFDLEFEPERLEYLSFSKTTFIGDSGQTFWVKPDSSMPGRIRNIAVTRTGRGEGVFGTGKLASVSLKALKPGNSVVKIENLKLSNAQAQQIPSVARNGKIRVISK